jgi:ferredoxin
MEVRIDRDTCIGSAQCVRVAAGIFDLDGDGLAFLADARTQDIDAVRSAIEACPTGSIHVQPPSS